MVDAVAQARERRHLIERIGAHVPGFRGYLERELRREMDQNLRAALASRLDVARARVNDHVKRMPLHASGELQRLASVEKGLDAAANALRHAGSGYAGLFDAVKVRDEELDALYRWDLDMVLAVDALGEHVSALDESAGSVTTLEQSVKAVRSLIDGRAGVVSAAFEA
ncbi:MAG: hypothetical protein ACM3O7_02840 [Acidobacteriota bacterium]